MSFGIYKQGQGYWVRTMTAVFAGVLVLVAAAWAWDQVLGIGLPAKGWELSVTVTSAPDLAEGSFVVLERQTGDGTYERVGSALVESYTPATQTRGTLTIRQVEMDREGLTPNIAGRVRAEDAASSFVGTITNKTPIPLMPVLYLQAAVAGSIIFIGALCIYWLVGVKPETVDFLVATDGEMKKVNWSTRKEIIGSTQVVIVAAVLIAGILFFIDLAFSNFFKFIGVLEG
ncbi:MAG: preprotein translocase subunit SecE [Planctomycetota bacterium]|nr:MAG: preprotein translocase subunit SecE [Planctomycetota bacterium]